ncbi:MAG: GAF domain-containing sensor histidine kinase [Patescibacteria group bacterium]
MTISLPQAVLNTPLRLLIALVVSIFIVLILDPLKKWIGAATDTLFFKARVDYQKLLTDLSEIINREIDLDILLFSLSRKLEKDLKVKNTSIYLTGASGGAFYKRRGRIDPGTGEKIDDAILAELAERDQHDYKQRISHNSALVKYMRASQEVVVLEGLERKIEDTQHEADRKGLEESKKELDGLDATIVAPITTGSELTAIMVLGQKLSGDPYGSEDLNLLKLIGPQLASALEKSRLYEEAQQFTERLKKEVAISTEDLRNTNLQLQERNKFLSALQNVTNLITRTLDFHKVTQTIADSIATELGYIGGIVLFLGKDRHRLFADAVTQSQPIKQALGLLPKPMSEYWGDYTTSKSRTVKTVKGGQVQIGTEFTDFLSPAVPEEIVQKMQKLLKVRTVISVPIYSEEGIVGAIVYLLAHEPGQIKPTDISIMKALANQSGIVSRNIELYRQLERSNKDLGEANKHLQQLDQAKSEFVSITSHQLRTPMTGIMGYLSMILQGDFGKVPKEQHKILVGLLEESQRMIRIINLFLNVSKIESGRLELNRTPVHIEEVVDKVMSMVQQAADEKKLKLIFHKPKKKLPLVFADKDKLGDIVLNFTDNAIKYTDEGSVTLIAEPHGEYMHFAVKDTGRGIEPEEAKKLFTKFVRGYGIAQVNPDGSGLGLYVARRLAEAHGGNIWVESDGIGKGSTFNVLIPLHSGESTTAEKEKRS